MVKGNNGHRLRQALRVAMHERVESISRVAQQVGISPSYLSQLLSGDKGMESVSDQLLRAFAAYLSMPPVAGFVLAGRLDVADFF